MHKLDTSTGNIFKLALPIYGGMLANTLVGIIDTGFMGRVGLIPQSAVGYGALFYLVFYLIGFGFVLGSQIIIARRVGEGALRRVGLIFTNTVIVMLFYVAILAILILFGTRLFFSVMLNSDVIAQQTSSYLQIRAVGLPCMALNLCFMAFYVGTARSKAIGISSILSGVVNVVLDFFLIYGYGKIEAMGLQGAAWASAISDMSGTLIFILYARLFHSFAPFRLKQGMAIRLSVIKQIFKVSTPLILQNFLSIFSWFLFFTLIEKTGERNFGISVILRSIYSLFMISAFALGSATNSMVSNLIGQGRHYEIGTLLKRITRISFLFIAVSTLPVWLIPETLFMLFTHDAGIAKDAVDSMYVIGIAMFILSVSNIYFQAVSGTGNTNISLRIEAVCIVLYLLYSACTTMLMDVPLSAIWIAEVLYMASFGLLAKRYMDSGKWKNKRIE